MCDSDQLARAALQDPANIAALVQWWGKGVLHDDGSVDRGAVAKIVFGDTKQRRRLEALTHPWIEERRRAAWASPPDGTRALVLDAPLLFEAGLADQCDAVIFVAAPLALRVERTAARGWSAAELRRREESQMSLDEKRARADHVLQNTGDLDALRAEVHRILSDIVESHRQKPGSGRS